LASHYATFLNLFRRSHLLPPITRHGNIWQ
jgi:hypothetical protein